MHEASLVQGLLKIALNAFEDYRKAARGSGEPKLTGIVCEAGLLACFEAETLKACFEIFAEGTAAENAELLINTKPLDCVCNVCGSKFALKTRHFICPACGSDQISFKGGNGLALQALKIDVEDKPDD